MGQGKAVLSLLPLEAIALFAITAAVLFVGATDVGLYLPDTSALIFSATHYLGPLTPIALLALTTRLRSRTTYQQGHQPTVQLLVRMALALTAIVFVHFNLKMWSMVVHPDLYDAELRTTDLRLEELRAMLIALHDILRGLFFWPHAYHDVFVGMFVVSFSVHGWRGAKELQTLAVAVALVLLIGGLTYWIAPAKGPFIWGDVLVPEATAAVQKDMNIFTTTFAATGGAGYSGKYFVAMLAAMPSLHVAHTVVLVWFAWRFVSKLGWIYLLPFAYIISAAVAEGWHYVVDLPAGALVAVISIWLAGRLSRQPAGKEDGLGSSTVSSRLPAVPRLSEEHGLIAEIPVL